MKFCFYRFNFQKISSFFYIIFSLLSFLSTDICEAKSSKSSKTISRKTNTSKPFKLKYAAFIMDAQSGKILHSNNATARIPPASLTKMMTLYILFEELAAKRLTMNSLIPISKYASRQSPSKLGVSAGGTVTVKEALLALMTRSANDIAVAVAEEVSGSEEAFVQRMNDRARSLKMSQTIFKNPSGLPNSQQFTTAYDMALLSQGLLKNFPLYYRYFNTKTFEYKGQKINNHNKLLGKIEGLDGIKTGFTCASGFNIATSVMRQGRRLIGVVMGGETAKWRDQRMAQLLEDSFLKFPHTQKGLTFDIPTDLPLVQVAAQSLKPQILPLQRGTYKTVSEISNNQEFNSKEETCILEKGDWYAQIGTYKQAKEAHMEAALALSKLPQGYRTNIYVIKSDLKRSRLYRARLGKFSRSSADKVCQTLKQEGLSCLTLKDTRTKIQTAMMSKK